MSKDYSKNISLKCPICGGNKFKYEDPDIETTCDDCGHKTYFEELKNDNGSLIESEVKLIKEKFVADFKNQLKKTIKGLK